jgi:soluble lytic murein transglycosylase
MTPPAATMRRSSAHARRRAAGRRRRMMLATIAFVGAIALAVVLAMPLFKKAVKDIGGLPLSYSDVIRQQAAEKHLDPALIAAVIYAETKFDPRPSSAGAEGLMQILPQTAEFLARRSGATTFTVGDLGTPQVNISYGSYYIRYLLDEYHGSTMLAVAAYNAGETNVNRWLASARDEGRTLTVNAIPFSQTRAYVVKVLGAQRDYRRTYASQLGYS